MPVSRQLLFLDNQMMLGVVFNQLEVPKSLHKHTDSRPRSAYHCRQFFVRDLYFDANAPRVFLAELPGDLKQRLTQALLAINGHEVGDYLLLVRDPHRQVSDEAFEERIFCQAIEKLATRDLFQESVFHRGRRFQPASKSRQTQLAENISRAVNGEHTFLTFL